MRVLGLETSCDETGLAIFDSEQLHQPNQGLVGQVLYSQIALHATYGGVVPELASRDHIRKLVPLLQHYLGAVWRWHWVFLRLAYIIWKDTYSRRC